MGQHAVDISQDGPSQEKYEYPSTRMFSNQYTVECHYNTVQNSKILR